MATHASEQHRSYAVAPLLGGIELLSGAYRAHRFTPHAHDTAAIGVVRHGEALFEGGGERFILRPGSVLVVPPRVIHDATTIGGGGRWEYQALYLDTRQLDAVTSALGDGEGVLGARPFVLHGDDVADRLIAVHEMLTRCVPPDDGDDGSCAEGGSPATGASFADASLRALRALLYDLQDRSQSVRGTGPGGALSARVARVRRAIDEAPLDRRTLADMARMAGVSRFAFVHAFSRAYGVSPHAYLLQRRVAVAREMLVAGALVSRAAHSVGFADQSHLTRRFRAVVGVTPGEFRRAWQLTQRRASTMDAPAVRLP